VSGHGKRHGSSTAIITTCNYGRERGFSSVSSEYRGTYQPAPTETRQTDPEPACFLRPEAVISKEGKKPTKLD